MHSAHALVTFPSKRCQLWGSSRDTRLTAVSAGGRRSSLCGGERRDIRVTRGSGVAGGPG